MNNLPSPTNPDPALAEAWQDWIAYRKERKEPLGSIAAKKQLKFLDQWGKDRFILAIETSINRNWIGLFEPQVTPASRQSVPLWQQIKNLELEINNHPANHQSLSYDPGCSPETKENLINKRKLLYNLRNGQTSPSCS